jgi:hypothetical protein
MGTDAGLSDHDLIVLPGLDGTTLLLNEFLMRARSQFASVQAIAYPPDQRLDYDQLEVLVRQSLPSNRRTGDRLISASTGPRLVAAIERAELVDIPGPHLLLQAAPKVSLKAIIEFCQRLDQNSVATPLETLERRNFEGEL